MILIVVFLIVGLIGGAIASSKGRSFFGWFLICFLTGGLGILILIFLSSATANNEQLVAAINDAAAKITPPAGFDASKWAALLRFDDEVAAAAAEVRSVDPRLEEELAKAYLALNDKAYLRPIVDKLLGPRQA